MDVILIPLLQLIIALIGLYIWLLIASVILSWLVAFQIINTGNRFVGVVGEVLYRLTEPLLGQVRRVIPSIGGIDLSPVVVIFGLSFLQGVLSRLAFKLL